MFSPDVTAAMLVSWNKGTSAMLVSPTNPSGIELYSYANVFFFLVEKHAYWSREGKHSIVSECKKKMMASQNFSSCYLYNLKN